MAVPDLSFSSDALRTAMQYADEAATCTEVTSPTGDPCNHAYAQRVNKLINDLNDEETATRNELKAMHPDMLETLQAFEDMENTIASSFNAFNEG